ncbi:MAG: FAD-dependent oxidoreductase, partial [Proteobacteria bacterium]|nr:FAD-dependent oxidoreductase [Pseudomonadota bacterium]
LDLGEEVLRILDYGADDIKSFGGRGIGMATAGQLRECQIGFATFLRRQSIELLTDSPVSRISNRNDHFELDIAGGSIDVTSPLVLANAQSIQQLLPEVKMKLQSIRGQATKISGLNLSFDGAVCGAGYVAGLGEGSVWSSGTFDVDSDSIEYRYEDNLENMQRLDRVLGATHRGAQETVTEAWVGVRYATYDRMPHVGVVGPGLYALTGLGAKGFTWGPLAAEVLVSELLGLSCPVERSLKARMNPLRFR